MRSGGLTENASPPREIPPARERWREAASKPLGSFSLGGVPELRFTARTHTELVRQVREWLASAERERTMSDVVTDSADLTKDALRILASAAPGAMSESELVRSLVSLGYRITDTTRDTLVAGLDALGAVSDPRVTATAARAYKLNTSVAKVVRSLTR